MLKKVASCQNCGAEMSITRRTKAYCSDACRKAANREADSGRRAEAGRLIETLARLGHVGPIWPVLCLGRNAPHLCTAHTPAPRPC